MKHDTELSFLCVKGELSVMFASFLVDLIFFPKYFPFFFLNRFISGLYIKWFTYIKLFF